MRSDCNVMGGLEHPKIWSVPWSCSKLLFCLQNSSRR